MSKFEALIKNRKIVRENISREMVNKEIESASYDLEKAKESFERKDFKWTTIHSQASKQCMIDYRKYDFDNVKYEKVNLPNNVTEFCLALIKNYGLSFGEIDMIYTKKGEYVFLEINPNGQWLWLEIKSGYNLTKDVAENLL